MAVNCFMLPLICQLDGYHPTLIEKRKHYGNGRDPLKQALTVQTKKIGADAIVITGDVVDFYEGTTAKGDLRAGQIEYLSPLAARVGYDRIRKSVDDNEYQRGVHQAQIRQTESSCSIARSFSTTSPTVLRPA